MKEAIKGFEDCIIDSTNSFLYERSYPTNSTERLAAFCKQQTEGLKCIKEKAKGGNLGIVKRGLLSFVATKQRSHKKYCTNLNSEASKSYVNAMQCVMKKFPQFRDLDATLTNNAIEIERRNYTDSAIELKQICCSLYTHKKNMHDIIGNDCKEHRAKVDEFLGEFVPEDLNVICEDEEKMLTKICPNIEKINTTTKYDPKSGSNASGLWIYLIATLGEARR